MTDYTVTAAARCMDIPDETMRKLIRAGIVDIVDRSGRPAGAHGFDDSLHRVPEWVVAELVESPNYVRRASSGVM